LSCGPLKKLSVSVAKCPFFYFSSTNTYADARSLGAYECLPKSGMVILSCPKTLRSYLGSSTMDVGVTDIVKEALKAKMAELGFKK
jgi:hypothetical protein